MADIEQIAPRERTVTVVLGDRTYTVTVKEHNIRKMNAFEDAIIDIDRRSLEAAGLKVEDETAQAWQNRVLIAQEKARAAVLPFVINFQAAQESKPTPQEYEDTPRSVVAFLLDMQQELNKRSDVVGEFQRRLEQYLPATQETHSEATSSAPEESESSANFGSGASATNLEPSTI